VSLRGFLVPAAGIALIPFLCCDAFAAWQVVFDAEANRVMHMGGNTRRGNFATKDDCMAYWRSRSGFERNHSYCDGYNSGSSGGSGGYRGGTPQQQIFLSLFEALLNGAVRMLEEPAPPRESPAAKQKREQEEKKRSEEYMEKVKAQILQMERDQQQAREKEFQRGLAGLKGSLKGREPVRPAGDPAEVRAMTVSAIEQLSCGAYWGVKAMRSAIDGNDNVAR
jgi:hypothetical protein